MEERRIHWIYWKCECKPKCEDGMGFKDLITFNLAMLAKQSWHLMHDESLLMHKVYKTKYFSDRPFMEAKLDNNPSYTWQSIWEARSIVLNDSR